MINFNPAGPQRTETSKSVWGTSQPSAIEQLKEVLPPIIETMPGLKQKTPAGEYAGPCLCGGTDRFYVRPDGSCGCRHCDIGGDIVNFYQRFHNTNIKGLAEKYLNNGPIKKEKARAIPANLTATYQYVDESGNPLYETCRYEENGKEKTFRQRHYQNGQSVFGLSGVRRVLYNLPGILQAQGIIIVEGEKDADRLIQSGLPATTSPMGANAWKSEYAELLKGKNVAILPDNDTPGRKHAAKIVNDLLTVANSVRVVELPDMPPKGDVSDWLNSGKTIDDLNKNISDTPVLTASAKANTSKKLSPRERLSALTVQEDYVAMIGNEAWLFPNLIIKNQILVTIAKSGGGKTTINFDFVVPWIIEHTESTVYYFDVDSPASDHSRMLEKAKEIGARLQWVNPLTHGKSADELKEILKDFVESGERLDNVVFFFDTMKKFIDMLNKESVKPFFTLLRQLTALGATVVLLGHANKHRDIAGNLVFEGVGDVVSDSDALLFFERITSPDGGDYITTVCDPDKGAKVRGLYDPISFHIAKDRTVTQCKEVIPVPDWSPGGAKKDKLTEEEIQDRIREFLADRPEPIGQSMIISALTGEPGISYHRVRKILTTCAIRENEAEKGQFFCVEGNQFNKKMYGVS